MAEHDKDRSAEDDDGTTKDIFPTVYRSAQDAVDVTELAQAERAVAQHAATPEQVAGVSEAGQERRAEDRLERWQGRRSMEETSMNDPSRSASP